jgi:Zinc finger, C3HC4 type (RING finger)
LSCAGSYPSQGVDTIGLKKDTACVICFEAEGDRVLLPCGHAGYCGACADALLYSPNRFRLCPICRASLGSVARVDLNTDIGSAGNVLEASVGLVEPSSESVELSQWRTLLRESRGRRGLSQTFPQESRRGSSRARAASASASNNVRARWALLGLPGAPRVASDETAPRGGESQ